MVTIDTRQFLGRKDATIKVMFDKPFKAEVQLQVHCNIRGDVVVQPGVVDFGSVPQGSGAQQQAAVSYAGRRDWQILRVESPNPNLSAKVVEKSRALGPAWRVEYDLLRDAEGRAPAGYVRDDLILVTNDANPQAARVPVPVEAHHSAGRRRHPSPMLMPRRRPGRVHHPALDRPRQGGRFTSSAWSRATSGSSASRRRSQQRCTGCP